MGAWDVGLYSSDFGEELRTAIKTICRLPFSDERIIEIIIENHKSEALNKYDSDYTCFWLILADQLHRRGMATDEILQKAIDIIESGKDLKIMKDLGMDSKNLEKRSKILDKLKDKLAIKVNAKKRNVIKQPEELLMSTGDVIVYPVDKSGEVNDPNIKFIKVLRESYENYKFEQAGWGAAVIINSHLVYDFFACYQILIYNQMFHIDNKPEMEQISKLRDWFLPGISGTCSKRYFDFMELEIIGQIKINKKKIKKLMHRGLSCKTAVSIDRDLSEGLKTNIDIEAVRQYDKVENELTSWRFRTKSRVVQSLKNVM